MLFVWFSPVFVLMNNKTFCTLPTFYFNFTKSPFIFFKSIHGGTWCWKKTSCQNTNIPSSSPQPMLGGEFEVVGRCCQGLLHFLPQTEERDGDEDVERMISGDFQNLPSQNESYQNVNVTLCKYSEEEYHKPCWDIFSSNHMSNIWRKKSFDHRLFLRLHKIKVYLNK